MKPELDASADRTPCCIFVTEALKHNDGRNNHYEITGLSK